MIPKSIRVELLKQHAELRTLMAVAHGLAKRVRQGEPLRQELKESALRVLAALRTHNDREERLLREIAPLTRRLGVPQIEIMNEVHFEEHKAIHVALLDINLDADDYWAAKNLADALDKVESHVALEERAFDGSGTWREEDTIPDGALLPPADR
jgi:hypothetical protein